MGNKWSPHTKQRASTYKQLYVRSTFIPECMYILVNMYTLANRATVLNLLEPIDRLGLPSLYFAYKFIYVYVYAMYMA